MSPNGLDHRSVIVRGDAPSETTVRSVMAWVIDSAVARSISPPPPKLFPPPPKLFPPPPKLFPEELARAAVAPFWAKSKLPGQLVPQSHAPKNSSLGLPS